MLRLPYPLLLSLGILASACGSGSSAPSEYISFQYSITPPGFQTNAPIVLPAMPAPTAQGMTCFKQNQQLIAYGQLGAAQVQITLTGSSATQPYQRALQASSATVGVAEVNLQIPLGTDEMGNYINPAAFKTAQGNVLTCYISLSGPDLYASFDGTFFCDTLSTDPGRQLHLTEGAFHTVPCAAGQ